jgi:acetylornithine deacetylase
MEFPRPPEDEIEEAAQLLAALIAVPSITLAQGQPAPDERHGEARLASVVATYLAGYGIACEFDEIEPGRTQISARVGSGKPELLLTSHLDTVPPVSWPSDPFRAVRIEDELHGLGACDDKGSLTAMLLAFQRFAQGERQGPGTLIFIGMVGEEMFGVGSRALVAGGYRPDAAIVGEPTELRLVRVECGNVRWRFHTLGRSSHGSRPWEGESAIYRMADALTFLRDRIAPECRGKVHPLTGPAAFNVGLVSGGVGVNIVPDRCTATVERRVLPGEEPLEAMHAINRRLAEHLGKDRVHFDVPMTVNHPVDTPVADPVCESMAAALRAFGLFADGAGVSYGSDANRLAGVGVPCLVFGPGSIAQAHTNDEWVDLVQVALAARVLEETAARFFLRFS